MRLSPLLPLAVLAAACSSAPPPDPAPPPSSAAAALPSASAPAPSASAPARAPLVRAKVTVLEVVDGVTVTAHPPTGFDQLTQAQRVLAYHLTQASLAGDALFTMQRSKHAFAVTELIRALRASEGTLDPAFRPKLATYRKSLSLNHGMFEHRTGQKNLPPFSQKELLTAMSAAKLPVSRDLLAAMFDPRVEAVVVNKTPGKGKDPLVESAANHYEGVTSKDLEKYEEKFPLNGRIVKEKGAIVEQVYRAGGSGAPPGLGAKQLARVVGHLKDAITVAPPEQREALSHLVTYFETGDNAEFQKHDIAWLKQVFPVDYILGFIETYSDVRERKGSFESFIAIPDPERDPPLQALARSAQYFEQRMPWDAKWKRDTFRVPAAAAVTVLAANADGGPFTFSGVNLPNAEDLREKYGSKNFVALSTTDTREELTLHPTIDEFAPEESRAELHRCARWLGYAAVGFHEITGHGSGKVNPDLKGDPAQLLAPYYAAMEEGRAQRVADVLTGDPKTIEIGLLPDVGCAKIYPTLAAMNSLLALKYVPVGEVAEEDHLRADLIDLGWLRDHGVVTVEERKGKTFLVVKDPEAWRKASSELLAELQRIKATADRPALAALVEKYGSRINPKWRDEVLARLKALSLPRSIATIPPMLTPVRDAAGVVVDAKAAQTTSLDAYLTALENASKD